MFSLRTLRHTLLSQLDISRAAFENTLQCKQLIDYYLLINKNYPSTSAALSPLMGSRSIRKDLLERVRSETNTIGVEELVLELNPVKTKGM
jgi:hypothetical protein